jgi:hypothetical protein
MAVDAAAGRLVGFRVVAAVAEAAAETELGQRISVPANAILWR